MFPADRWSARQYAVSAATIKLRSMLRRAGVTRLLPRLRLRRRYEERFRAALSSEIRPGDTVWDVGANVGLYTRLFHEWVGADGQVIAFEPVPACCEALKRIFHDTRQVTIAGVAMGDEEGRGIIELDKNPVSPLHKLATAVSPAGAATAAVRIVTGDRYAESCGHVPDVIKIDVEGFEYQVLSGMRRLLGCSKLRAIFVEVHFALLEERGQMMAPVQMVQDLKDHGFKTNWLDSSHLRAVRV